MESFRVFLEAFGNFNYVVPKDKEQQLFDFYMLSNISKNGNERKYGGEFNKEDELNYTIEEVKNTLLPKLKENLLDAVFFSIASEVRYATVKGNEDKLVDRLYRANPNWESMYWIYLGFNKQNYSAPTPDVSHIKDKDKRYLGDLSKYNTRNNSYAAALKASNGNKREFVELSRWLFDNVEWEDDYGGEAWSKICTGWIKLDNAKTNNEMFVWIDHIYSLQHNTDTVFNKIKSYSKSGGYDWIKEALDLKFKIKEPSEIIDRVSPKMKYLATRAIKNLGGKSFESIEKEKHLNYIRHLAESLDDRNFPLLKIPSEFNDELNIARITMKAFNHDLKDNAKLLVEAFIYRANELGYKLKVNSQRIGWLIYNEDQHLSDLEKCTPRYGFHMLESLNQKQLKTFVNGHIVAVKAITLGNIGRDIKNSVNNNNYLELIKKLEDSIHYPSSYCEIIVKALYGIKILENSNKNAE